MQKKLMPSFIKLIVFLGFILLVVAAVRFAAVKRIGNGDLFNEFYISSHKTKKHVYFIGTSRTRNAVNDSLLNALMPRAHFVNTGIGYGTLNSSAVLAQKIMQRVPSSILFIELSVANGRMPGHFSMMADARTTFSALKGYAQDAPLNELQKIHLPFAENYMYDYIGLRPYLKLLSGNASVQEYWGRVARYESLKYNMGTFLNSSDLNNTKDSCAETPGIYKRMIQPLLQKAAAANCEVIFYLPVCTDNEQEKNRLLCVYNSLPQKNKLPYSAAFLSAISKPEYLADGIHFNVNGADVFTNYLFDFIKNRFEVQGDESGDHSQKK